MAKATAAEKAAAKKTARSMAARAAKRQAAEVVEPSTGTTVADEKTGVGSFFGDNGFPKMTPPTELSEFDESQPVPEVPKDEDDGPIHGPKDVNAVTKEGVKSVAGEQLLSIIGHIENILIEIAGLRADVKEVFDQSKGFGFDNKIIRLLLRMRARSAADVQEEELLLETYKRAIGM